MKSNEDGETSEISSGGNHFSPSPASTNGHQTLADLAYEQLEYLIVTLAYMPGDVISESSVCKKLNLGRTPVREALLRLRYTRLIEPGQGRSHVVTPLDYAETLQIMEVARLLERVIVERAVVQRTALQAMRFSALADSFPALAARNDTHGYLQAHGAMNRLIGEAARHPVVARVMAPLISLTRRVIVVHVLLDDAALSKFALGHVGLARALCEGDAKQAIKCLDIVLDRWIEIIEALATRAATSDIDAVLRERR